MKQYDRLQVSGFSLFELLISVTLLVLMLTLLITIGTQVARLWSEEEEEEEMIHEGRDVIQMMCQDLRSASLCVDNLRIDTPLTSCQKNIFFLTRTPSDHLVTAGYFLDPGQKGHCYRYFANAQETLAAQSKGRLPELESQAAPGEGHCELIARHLLSWEIIPVWKSEKQLALCEINLAFGKTTPYYFLSTVVAVSPSR